ncbi:acyl-CoA synthetase [Prescottella agglutinans]|uniref:Fatty-acyl-CoA synthase n=1 Tax=Prescottella agglutinans TaxID=1644129 RepID=A0ABT6M9V0_9NOCA|nr:acyl-CoA synthetase [Prescottella agglutinans]MDH6281082.1 fatty-acyl-CoA synthase [Prescottella agglutinans]
MTDDQSAVRALAAVEAVPLERHDLPATTYEILARTAARSPDSPALHHLPGGVEWNLPETWTYEALLHRVHQAANLYESLGVPPGGVVALMLPNGPTTYAALLGAQVHGVVNPLNPALHTDHIVEILQLTGAEVLCAPAPEIDAALWRKALDIAAALPTLRVLLSVGGTAETDDPRYAGDFDRLAAAQTREHLCSEPRAASTDIAAYFHTGGTTGTPKVAPHTHANEVYMAWAVGQLDLFRDGTVVLAGLPLFHVNAVHITALAPFLHGHCVVSLGRLGYRDRAAIADFWRIVEHYRITTFSAVPTVYSLLPPVPEDIDISSLRGGIVGAAPLPARVRTEFESRTGVPMVEGYGLTEATCASVVAPMMGNRAGALGLRLPYQRIRAVRPDPEGDVVAECAPGETGVLAVQGPSVFPGYLRDTVHGPRPDPAGTVVDGWLITGDLGRVDADGFVYLSGRAKDVIIRGGHNIDPRPVEDSLLAHPDIVEAAVVGCPDRHAGEVPVAYVVLRQGCEATSEDLAGWAAAHAPEPAAAPRFVHRIAELPTTAVGKVHKLALVRDCVRRMVEQELEGSGVEGSVEVVELDGRPHARVLRDARTRPESIDDLVDRLARYSFTHTVAASAD